MLRRNRRPFARRGPATRPLDRVLDPRSSEVITNLYLLNTRKDGLKQLEEDLDRPLRGFVPRSSLEGVLAPPPAPQSAEPVMPSKRVRELLERQKYWAFMSLDDFLHTPTAEEVLKVPAYGPDGQPIKSLSPLERYWERLDHERATGARPGLDKDDSLFGNLLKRSNVRDGGVPQEQLPASLGKAEQELEKILRSDAEHAPDLPSAKRSIFSDIFGLEQGGLAERSAAQKARMDEFKQLLGMPPATPASGDGANPLTDLITSTTRPEVKPVGALPGVPPAGSVPVAGSLANPFKPAYIAGGLPEATARALNSPPPPPPPPPTLAPPKPTFEFPRRKF